MTTTQETSPAVGPPTGGGVTGSGDREPESLLAILWRKPFPFAPGEDPDAAPGARPPTDGVLRWTPRRAVQNGAWTFVVGLAFLVFFLIPLLAQPPVWWELIVALALALVIAVAYVGTALAADLPLAARVAYVIGFLAVLCVALYPFIGPYVITMTPYAAIMTAHLLPWRISRLALPIGTVAGVAVGIGTDSWISIVLAVIGGGLGFFMAMGIETRRIQGRLSRAEQRIATLAVAAERERIARDLHDILGHSLTAVAVKAGLAARLTHVDATAAKAQMVEVEQIARQALADVRATASGFRHVRLAGEIASARSVLQAAGIVSTVPEALEPMPDAISELFGYVVREAVTNVIRHAGATTCVITASAYRVSVCDDGVGPGTGDGTGSGLEGLRLRAEQLGVTVTSATADAGGTVLTADRRS
jgi:two-component system sensor histidine kinase DesK